MKYSSLKSSFLPYMGHITFICLMYFMLGCECSHHREKVCASYKIVKILRSEKYVFSTNKFSIPKNIISTLKAIDNGSFRIGDDGDNGRINLSDVDLVNYDYNKKLNFVVYNQDFCLLSYVEGGIGKHDVIDFFQTKPYYKHIRYSAIYALDDTSKVCSYLTKCPSSSLPVKN